MVEEQQPTSNTTDALNTQNDTKTFQKHQGDQINVAIYFHAKMLLNA